MGVDSDCHLISQCYDGASVTSGRLGGLQSLMRESICTLAIYVHCWASIELRRFLRIRHQQSCNVLREYAKRFTNYFLLSINRERTSNIDLEDIVNCFAILS